MIYYTIKTGELKVNNEVWGTGYSGHGSGLNNEEATNIHDVGPIPKGLWHLSTWEDFHPHLGRDVTHLIPDSSTETFGRSAFFMHGDNAQMNHTASDGCIILNAVLRERLRTSGEKLLTVQ